MEGGAQYIIYTKKRTFVPKVEGPLRITEFEDSRYSCLVDQPVGYQRLKLLHQLGYVVLKWNVLTILRVS